MTPELYAIIGVGLALAGILVPASNRQSRDIAGLRQEMNQDIAGLRQEMSQQGQQINQQINQLTHQVGHLSGVVEGLRGRPIVIEQPEESRV